MDFLMLFLLACLASYRIARMLAREEGPFGLFTALQGLGATQRTWWQRGLQCPLCIGFWVAPLVVLLVWGPLPWAIFVLRWLAVAGGAAWLQMTERGDE